MDVILAIFGIFARTYPITLKLQKLRKFEEVQVGGNASWGTLTWGTMAEESVGFSAPEA